ncbi:MAG TPA: FAD/NAD(P)-binding protein [Rhizomicrobium sp.]
MNRQDVAICGNGAAAVALFRALARGAQGPLAVAIVGPEAHFAKGIAYGTRDPAHVLNVPAEKMSADAEEPEQFAAWLRHQDIRIPDWPHSFMPRELYGRYLADLVERTRQEFRGKIDLNIVSSEVVGLGRQQGGWCVFHAAGVLTAGSVVLATGHGPPQPLALQFGGAASHAIIDDPWTPWSVEPTARILIVGSGLTAVDTALSLLKKGHSGKIVLLSRHGRLPQVHVAHRAGAALPGPYPGRASILLRSLRSAVRSGAPAQEWQAVIDAMRPHWQDAWTALRDADKRRALRHGLSVFNAHRHRVAPHQGRQIADAVADGRIEILRGRLLALTPQCNSVRARIATPAGRLEPAFGRVVNCSGPNSDVERSPGTLLKTLIARGLARPGPADLGIDVDDGDRVLDRDGGTQPGLFAMGALTRGKWWEITAMPEIALQARRIARTVLMQRVATRQTASDAAGHTLLVI